MKLIKVRNYNWIWIVLSMLCLSFGRNSHTNYLVHICIATLVFILPFYRTVLVYLFISIWINIMYQGQYQIFIFIIEAIITLKAIHNLFKKKHSKVKVKHVIFTMLMLFYISISFLLYKDLSALRLAFPIIIIWSFRTSIIKENGDRILRELFLYYVSSVLCGILYGLLNYSFMDVRYSSFGSMLRFSGIQAPNYMALYINIALAIDLFSDIFKPKLRYILAIGLFLGVLITMSTSGLFIGLMILACFLIYNLKSRGNFRVVLTLTLVFIFLITLPLILYYFNINLPQIGAITRIVERNSDISTFSTLTNKRSDLWYFYWKEFLNTGFVRSLLGSAVFSPLKNTTLSIEQLAGTHSTYLELLWVFGFIGTLIFILYVITNLKEIKDSKYYLLIWIIKIVLFINMISISLITNRLFYLLILL